MGHLTRREGDTFYMRGWWYRDEDEYLDTVAEYRQDELREARHAARYAAHKAAEADE